MKVLVSEFLSNMGQLERDELTCLGDTQVFQNEKYHGAPYTGGGTDKKDNSYTN